LHNLVLVQRGSDDLRHPDVVHVEVELVLGAHVDARLRAGLRQDALVPELLGGEGTLDAGGDGVGVANVQRLRPGDDELLHPLERLLHRLLVPFDDLGRVETVADELLGVAKQLTAEGHHQVGAIANLLLLRLRRHHQKFGSRVRDFELADDDRRVGGDEELVEVVDDHLVHAVGTEGGAGDLGELLARLHVLDHRLVEPCQVLVPVLEHGLKAVRHTSHGYRMSLSSFDL